MGIPILLPDCIARELRRDYTRKRLDRRVGGDGTWVLREMA